MAPPLRIVKKRMLGLALELEADEAHQDRAQEPHGLGLHDMSGSVWEWCADVYGKNAYASHWKGNPVLAGEGSKRVRRGGSWCQGLKSVRTAARASKTAGYGDGAVGFRLVRTP
ncbi:MAG: formylglycine-generating enzyme family protein [Proteobacteria bacterium]|nr:formylglycine-generating enzyme family protein [Pseudomonadota bacterium]MBU1594505.1 formylglycine-generating enzyme family protein [Pseudomonadota bacterium]